jgi:hypothetical protein
MQSEEFRDETVVVVGREVVSTMPCMCPERPS